MIQEMYAEIQRQTDKHSVSELCGIYGVSRSGYYKWLRRDGQINRYEKTNQILDNFVLDIHNHHPMMGYRQIRDKLCLEFGWVVSDPTVWKSMKRLGIKGYFPRRKVPVAEGAEHARYANILSRNFRSERPLEKIVTNKPYYHCLDQLMLLVGKKEEQTPQVVFHTDQGSVYSSRAFCQAHEHYNILRSMSREGTPTDNPIIEALNGWMKEELYLDFGLASAENVPLLLDKYVYYFNNRRPAAALGYKSPVQYKTELDF